ncbi:MAG: hypothetical protein LBD37_11000 [Treponema sp.]|jgi:23S rRNA (cytidine2498-2'-O)-methyltransferase|nr:hypothetical protein [Treponema sp.]
MTLTPLAGQVFQAVRGFADHLEWELGDWKESWGILYYKEAEIEPSSSRADSPPVFWHQNRWLEPFCLTFDSIGQAASALRGIQRNWAPVLFTQFRRGALISEKLPPLPSKPRPFPWTVPPQPMGSWTLVNPRTLIGSARCSSPFPGGAIAYIEDKHFPPSRAYLKLWEALTLCGNRPGPASRCLDAGASPGGWTWALLRLGASVLAVDRAPLEARIQALPGLSFIKHDAFTLKPETLGPVDWLFCDAACYPQRLYGWIEQWLESGLCTNYVCTLKMQGSAGAGEGFAVSRRFAAIPGSVVLHLFHNKHELTWIHTAAARCQEGAGGGAAPA